jgi:hypothetical protein
MPKPDVEMVHDETGHIYYGGKIWDITRMASGWVLSRPCNTEHMYTGKSVDDCLAWLQVQATV